MAEPLPQQIVPDGTQPETIGQYNFEVLENKDI